MKDKFLNGVYPVMLTPFTSENHVDYEALGLLTDWYIDNQVAGLFAVCQSSEMFFLSIEERVKVTEFIVKRAGGRVPVIASGHISDSIEDQAKELNAIAKTGADAVILITNRLAKEEESDEVWLKNLQELMSLLPEDVPLGFYECPYPYKRLITPEQLKWCAKTGRFYFTKDTSCDIDEIKEKIDAIKGSQLKFFNANTSTLLESLELGGNGFSGVMANFHPDLYVWLTGNYDMDKEKAKEVSDFLTTVSMIERQVYPVNAKYYQQLLGNFDTIHTRVKSADLLNKTAKTEVEALKRLTESFTQKFFH